MPKTSLHTPSFLSLSHLPPNSFTRIANKKRLATYWKNTKTLSLLTAATAPVPARQEPVAFRFACFLLTVFIQVAQMGRIIWQACLWAFYNKDDNRCKIRDTHKTRVHYKYICIQSSSSSRTWLHFILKAYTWWIPFKCSRYLHLISPRATTWNQAVFVWACAAAQGQTDKSSLLMTELSF